MLDALVARRRPSVTLPAIATALGLHALAIAAALIRLPTPIEIIEEPPAGPRDVIFRAEPKARPGDHPLRTATPNPKRPVKPHARALRPPQPVHAVESAPPAEPDARDPMQSDEPPSADVGPDGAPEGSGGPSGPAEAGCDHDCIGSGRGGHETIDAEVGVPNLVRPQPRCSPSAPQMPEQARLMGISGAVVVRYAVGPDGQVADLQIVNPSAPPVLIEAVQRWLTGCAFTPAQLQGRPVRVRITQPFVFRIQ